MSSHLLFLLGTFFLFIVLRVPVAFALGLSSLLTVVQLGLPFTSIVNQMFSGINEKEQQFPVGGHEAGGALHGLHPQKEESEADDPVPKVALPFLPAEKG